MESDYKSQRTRNIFSLNSVKTFKLSRTEIENYISCPRCFFLYKKREVKQPSKGGSFALSNAVDSLLKNEFDKYRIENKPHPYMVHYGIDAIPYSHQELSDWRMNKRGIKYLHEPTNFIVTGSVDDVWINSQGELIIVDYKTTSTKKDVTIGDSYKRQMEIYQWLFRRNGFKVSNVGYFLYFNGDSSRNEFISVLQFKESLLPYEGNDSWIENALYNIKKCLDSDVLPQITEDCDYCSYFVAVSKHVSKYQTLINESYNKTFALKNKARLLSELYHNNKWWLFGSYPVVLILISLLLSLSLLFYYVLHVYLFV